MEMKHLYDIVRTHRDRAWDTQTDICGPDYEPKHQDDGRPLGMNDQYWYLQGKAEAYAAVMSEIESAR